MAQSDLVESPKAKKNKLKPAARLVRTIIRILEGFYNANALAELFKIERRTVFRDLAILREEGIFTRFDKAQKCYLLQNECFTPKLKLTLFEAVLLHLLCDKQKQDDHDSLQAAMNRAVNKILPYFPPHIKEQIKSLGDCLDFDPAKTISSKTTVPSVFFWKPLRITRS